MKVIEKKIHPDFRILKAKFRHKYQYITQHEAAQIGDKVVCLKSVIENANSKRLIHIIHRFKDSSEYADLNGLPHFHVQAFGFQV